MTRQSISVSIPTDDEGYLGRECPKCEGYFKVKPGTGLPGGADATCWCPYCGREAPNDSFWTKDQIEYAESIALRKLIGEIDDTLERSVRNMNRATSRSSFVRIEWKLQRGGPHPIRYYREKALETTVVCSGCSLEYVIYGVFGFCPDCGLHNSLDILNKNLELVDKEVALAENVERDLGEHLVEDALENAVSAFDAFGREVLKEYDRRRGKGEETQRLSLQNIKAARDRLSKLVGCDLSDPFSSDDWVFVCRAFQKRHLIAHKLGVADLQYIENTGDPTAVIGRKVPINPNEVRRLACCLRLLGGHLSGSLAK